jgi:biotin transporter BioY
MMLAVIFGSVCVYCLGFLWWMSYTKAGRKWLKDLHNE